MTEYFSIQTQKAMCDLNLTPEKITKLSPVDLMNLDGVGKVIFDDIKIGMRKAGLHFEKEYIQPFPMNLPLEILHLSTRTYNCLRRAHIDTLNDLSGVSWFDLMYVRNMGKKSLLELQSKINNMNNERN